MIAGLSAPWIPFLVPLAMTVVLAIRHRVSLWNKKYIRLMIICLVWEVAVTIHKKLFTLPDQSFQFFLFYTLTFAYIHVRVYGKQIVPLYEKIIVFFCKVSLPFWVFSLLFPSIMHSIASFFPETSLGNNFLYIYNYIDPSKSEYYLRNSGFSWEPGRFAIMIVLGLYCNMLRHGVKFWKSRNAIWMIITLLSTMSTTGYSIVMMMYAVTILQKSKLLAKIGYSVILIPVIVYMFSLDFMGSKIKGQLDIDASIQELDDNSSYFKQEYGEDDYVMSLGRFESMYLEFENFKHDPILGYGRNEKHSYFRESIGSNIVLTGGIVNMFGMYGLFLGLFFYVLLYRSSKAFGKQFGMPPYSMLFFVIILSSVSYIVFTIPVFTAFWMYDYFADRKEMEGVVPPRRRFGKRRRRTIQTVGTMMTPIKTSME